MPKYVSDYYRVSGLSLQDGCCFLANRYNPKWGYKPREGESMLVTLRPKAGKADDYTCGYPLITDGWITDVWLSEANTVYLARSDRRVSRASNAVTAGLAPEDFEDTQLSASLFGIWGLNDQCVFAWGDGSDKKGRDTHPVFQFNGKKWKELPSPGFEVLSMHGVAPDFVYAAGHGSGISLWNGKTWKRMDVPGPETFTCVFAASPDEAYAVGVNNLVVEGSKHGWAKIAKGPASPAPLAAVAKWDGQLWIGANQFGLLRRVKKTSKLEVVKPNVHATAFDARKDLMIVTNDLLVSTSDGKRFAGVARGSVLEARGSKKLNDFVKPRRD